MLRALTRGILAGVLLSPGNVGAQMGATGAELVAFLKTIVAGAQLTTQQYSIDLDPIRSSNGKRAVVPTLNLVAGRMDAESCLYQLRLDLRWTQNADADAAETGGRSLIQKAPCNTLTDEVQAVVRYEVAALNRRLNEGGRFAINKEREQVIAAARRLGDLPQSGVQESFPAVTIGSRVNLRASPSLKAPVLAKLAPDSHVELLRTDDADWFRVRGQSGYVHASALASMRAGSTTQ